MRAVVVLSSALVLLVLPARGATAAGKPRLWQCTQIHNAEAQFRCYVRLLRQDIEKSRDPARELPRIDRRVLFVGGPVSLAGAGGEPGRQLRLIRACGSIAPSARAPTAPWRHAPVTASAHARVQCQTRRRDRPSRCQRLAQIRV